MQYNTYLDSSNDKFIITETGIIIKSAMNSGILIYTRNPNDTLELNENLIKIISKEFDYMISLTNIEVFLDVIIDNQVIRHYYDICKQDDYGTQNIECYNDTFRKSVKVEEYLKLTPTSNFINSYQFELFTINNLSDYSYKYLIVYTKEFLVYISYISNIIHLSQIFLNNYVDKDYFTLTKRDLEMIDYFKSMMI